MRKFITLVLATAMLVAACGDDDAAGDADLTDPASIGSCDVLADATILMLQDVIDFMGALTPEQFAALGEGPNETLDEIAVRGEALGTRAGELQCEDIDALVAERADQLTAEADNAMGQLIIQGTRDGQDVMGRLFR